MDKLSRKNLTGAALVLVAVLFAITAGGTALAQHHDDHGDAGHDTGQATEHVEQAATHDDPHADPHAAHDADSEHGEHGEHGEGHGNMPHLKNFIGWIAPALPDNVAHQLEAFVDPIFSLLVVLLLSLFFISLRKQLSARTPNRTQMAAELLLGGLYGLFQQIIGPSARRYTPFLGSLFLFILANNLIGMLPLSHSSTASFNTTTLALGVLTFLYVQGIALKENGIGGYLHHMAGSPRRPWTGASPCCSSRCICWAS